jgi:hypothetical protein
MKKSGKSAGYHIEPYHMNGLNWRLVPGGPEMNNIIIVTGFMPAWWEAEYGITFGRSFHVDAETHRKTLVRMELILKERFGDLPNFFFGSDYANSYPVERRYGDGFIPALFGADIFFDDASGHPYARPLELTRDQALNLSVPDVRTHPLMKALFDSEKGGFGTASGEQGFEGVINIAYKLLGEEMFIYMSQEPDLVRHVFDVVFNTIDSAVHTVREWQDPMKLRPTFFVHCDCLINMISGRMYEAQLLEFEKKFSKSFDLYGIHTCNWTVDPYLDAIAEVDGLGYLDMGPESDLDRVHSLFPDLRPTVFFPPERFRSLDAVGIRKEISELGKRINKGYILLSDLEAGTQDFQIRAAYEEAERL